MADKRLLKETGIIMSGDHPKLILDGIKTQTRRVIKDPRRDSRERQVWLSASSGKPSLADIQYEAAHPEKPNFSCPYGQVGDLLWVRETWRLEMHSGCWDVGYKNTVWKRDVGINPSLAKYKHLKDRTWIWRPSIFMPRWASRIEEIIKILRAERLREISMADAKAEGGYTIEEFIKMYLRLNHLPEDADPWNWVIGW